MMPPYMSVKVRQTTTPGTTCPTLYEECVDMTAVAFWGTFTADVTSCENAPQAFYVALMKGEATSNSTSTHFLFNALASKRG